MHVSVVFGRVGVSQAGLRLSTLCCGKLKGFEVIGGALSTSQNKTFNWGDFQASGVVLESRSLHNTPGFLPRCTPRYAHGAGSIHTSEPKIVMR